MRHSPRVLIPRVNVLTDARRGELPTRYLTDRDRFPADDLLTSDLGKARTWAYAPGVRRFVKRNLQTLPILGQLRRVWVNLQLVIARQAEAKPSEAASTLPAPLGGDASALAAPSKAPSKPRRRAIAKGKAPNKRPARRPGKNARQIASGRRTGAPTRKPALARKVA